MQVFLLSKLLYLGMETKLRAAVPHDLPGILKIVNHNILHSTAVYDDEPKTIEYMQAWFTEKQQGSWPVVVALRNNEVAGYGTYNIFKPKEGYKYTVEHSLYVADEFTGKGIGKLLMTELIWLAKQQGLHSMIGYIDADNKDSISFHKKFGFKEAGKLTRAGFKFNRWLDVILMELLLTEA